MFALADCNNFYVSCEKVFKPTIEGKPVIVLSNNDGCVISRSNEAKALNIKMATPFFKIKSLCKHHHVKVFSSNYTLYGDMSQRIMTALESFCPDIELYSIDEAFLKLDGFKRHNMLGLGNQIHNKVKQWTGIPVSIGIGPTKTLAKIASHIAKKNTNTSVFSLHHANSQDHWLAQFPAGDIWGIGKRWSESLEKMGIQTALQLKKAPADLLRSKHGVILERVYRELNGIPCLELEATSPKKSIVSSRSFGKAQKNYGPIAEALASYTARACEKLRNQKGLTRSIGVFIRTNAFKNDDQHYQNSVSCTLPFATNDTSIITKYAKQCLESIYKQGFNYQKTGIMLFDLSTEKHFQQDLFQDNKKKQKSQKLMKVVDNINRHMGKRSIFTAAQGTNSAWHMRRDHCSPRYTTHWQELPVVV
jgi:DNA polymerase V